MFYCCYRHTRTPPTVMSFTHVFTYFCVAYIQFSNLLDIFASFIFQLVFAHAKLSTIFPLNFLMFIFTSFTHRYHRSARQPIDSFHGWRGSFIIFSNTIAQTKASQFDTHRLLEWHCTSIIIWSDKKSFMRVPCQISDIHFSIEHFSCTISSKQIHFSGSTKWKQPIQTQKRTRER